MAMTIREAFQKGTDTFNAHDIDGFTSVLADDVVYRAPGGMSGQGPAACARFFAGWWDAFPDAHVDVHAVHPVAVHYIHMLRYRDGKHVSFNLLFDRLQMLEQLGLIPAPAPTS